MYEIRFAQGVERDLRRIRAYDRTRILDDIESQLKHDPGQPTRNKKRLAALVVPWRQTEPLWEIRIGEIRVFYDIDEVAKVVTIQAVRRKPHGKRTKEVL